MTIRDLQHRFDGRAVIVQVCARGEHPAPEPVPLFDSIIVIAAPGAMADHEDDEPEKIVRAVFDQVHPLIPNAVDADAWWEFEHRVHEWLCEHRAAAPLLDHANGQPDEFE